MSLFARVRAWFVADDPHPERSRLDRLDMRSWPHRQEHSLSWLGPDPASIDPPYVDRVTTAMEVEDFRTKLVAYGWHPLDPELQVHLRNFEARLVAHAKAGVR